MCAPPWEVYFLCTKDVVPNVWGLPRLRGCSLLLHCGHHLTPCEACQALQALVLLWEVQELSSSCTRQGEAQGGYMYTSPLPAVSLQPTTEASDPRAYLTGGGTVSTTAACQTSGTAFHGVSLTAFPMWFCYCVPCIEHKIYCNLFPALTGSFNQIQSRKKIMEEM